MGIKRIVDTEFWDDSKVIDMFSSEDKYFMLYLLTNPHTTQLGIYELNLKKAAFEIGYSSDAVSVLMDRFENNYKMIKYSQKTNEVAIKNFLRHSIVKGGKPVEDLLLKEIGKVKDKELLRFIFGNLERYDNLNETVKKIIINNKELNDNDNDNENEVSYHDSYHDSLPEEKHPLPEVKKESKHKYGHYQHVILKDSELEKLKTDYGNQETLEAIKYLDEYIEMKKPKYNNHNLVLRKWVFDAIKEEKKKRQPQSKSTNKFNQFPQREYSNNDMLSMEQRLLGGG